MIKKIIKYGFLSLAFVSIGIVISLILNYQISIKMADVNADDRVTTASQNSDMNGSFNDVGNSRQNAITRAVEMTSPAVVGINVTQVQRYYSQNPFLNDPFFRQFFQNSPSFEKKVQSLGSGFLFSSQGYVLTNQHVVENAMEIIVTRVGGKQYKATKVGEDYESDIAVLKIDDDNFPFAPLGDSDDVIIGEWAIALGNPFGLFDITSKPTVTVGVISAKDQDFGRQSNDRLFEDMLQTDAAINGGNSGGPLVNCNGEVIGINTWIISGSDTRTSSIGLGFAMPINRVKKILNDLISYGHVDRTYWTGIQYDVVTPSIAKYLGMKKATGAIISDIEKNSPAESAGIEIGDVILAINDNTIQKADDISAIIENLDLKAGDILELKIYRDKKSFTSKVILAPNSKKPGRRNQ